MTTDASNLYLLVFTHPTIRNFILKKTTEALIEHEALAIVGAVVFISSISKINTHHKPLQLLFGESREIPGETASYRKIGWGSYTKSK